MKDKNESNERDVVSAFIGGIITIWVVNAWWPDILASLPTFGEPFWNTRGTWHQWLGDTAGLYVWGVAGTLVCVVYRWTKPEGYLNARTESPSAILWKGTLLSIVAGVLEELAFRWVLYLSAIVTLVLFNWLLGTVFLAIFLAILAALAIAGYASQTYSGWALFAGVVLGVLSMYLIIHPVLAPVKWLHLTLAIPLADWTSFGLLHDQLYQGTGPDSWALGAGIISANAFFRDQHKYLGIIGVLNTWFIGLVMFWVVFTYGLVPAMLVHTLYDVSVFATSAFLRVWEQGR